jgi:hypothetical protein
MHRADFMVKPSGKIGQTSPKLRLANAAGAFSSERF